jgi:hypothetical protein
MPFGRSCFSHGLLKPERAPNTNTSINANYRASANYRAIAYSDSDRHSHHSTIPYFIAYSYRDAHGAANSKKGIALRRSLQVVAERSAKAKRKKSEERSELLQASRQGTERGENQYPVVRIRRNARTAGHRKSDYRISYDHFV